MVGGRSWWSDQNSINDKHGYQPEMDQGIDHKNLIVGAVVILWTKGATRHLQKFLPTWSSKKIQYKNTRKDWIWSFLVAWVLPIPSGPPLWCMPEKFHYNPGTHFFTSGQYYPLQPSKIPCEFLVHSHLLALVLASNYPNVNPKCELQAWWTNE